MALAPAGADAALGCRERELCKAWFWALRAVGMVRGVREESCAACWLLSTSAWWGLQKLGRSGASRNRMHSRNVEKNRSTKKKKENDQRPGPFGA